MKLKSKMVIGILSILISFLLGIFVMYKMQPKSPTHEVSQDIYLDIIKDTENNVYKKTKELSDSDMFNALNGRLRYF